MNKYVGNMKEYVEDFGIEKLQTLPPIWDLEKRALPLYMVWDLEERSTKGSEVRVPL